MREREIALASELKRIETRKRELIRAVVRASLDGRTSKSELNEMEQLSTRKADITRPTRSLAAA